MTTRSNDLSDIEICSLDLLLRAKRKGAPCVSRRELINSTGLPDVIRVRLVFTMLLMSGDNLVQLHDDDSFEITPSGENAFALALGKTRHSVEPSSIADGMIALPDQSGERLQ